MIILRVILVGSLANQSDEEIPVDAFVVMQWHEIQIVQAQAGGDEEDYDDADSPGVLRQTFLARRCFLLETRSNRLFSARFLIAA